VTAFHSPAAERDRRRRLVQRIVLVAVLVLVLAATAVFWPRPVRGDLTVSTTSQVDPAGVLKGEVAASRVGDRACYSVTSGTGTAVLRFVPGWSADTKLGLRDTSGLVVAQPGDTVVLLGAPGTVGAVAGCTQQGRIWTVTTVRSRS
jgi:hypothetical protein